MGSIAGILDTLCRQLLTGGLKEGAIIPSDGAKAVTSVTTKFACVARVLPELLLAAKVTPTCKKSSMHALHRRVKSINVVRSVISAQGIREHFARVENSSVGGVAFSPTEVPGFDHELNLRVFEDRLATGEPFANDQGFKSNFQ